MAGSNSNLRNGRPWFITLAIVVLLGVAIYQQLAPYFARGNSSVATGSIPAVVGARPDPNMTPGDVLTTNLKTICTPGYTQTVRDVPSALKRQVYSQYGIRTRKPGEYEIDHLISLELGGSNSVRNLWPESYLTKPLNAHVKDDLENKLHELICTGKIPVAIAQQTIASDWIAAYVQYTGPLPR